MTTADYRRLQEYVEKARALAESMANRRTRAKDAWEREGARLAHVRLDATRTTLASLRLKAETGETHL